MESYSFKQGGSKANSRGFSEEAWVEVDCRGCTRCCWNTMMPLTRSDVERITRLGYKVEEFAIRSRGVLRLRNVNGHCYFLDPRRGCRIYPYRPLGCRLYPVILVSYKTSCRVTIDHLCPRRKTARIYPSLQAVVKQILRLVHEVYGVNVCSSVTVDPQLEKLL